MKQLYGFEIFVESIQFLEKVKNLVSAQQIMISVQIGDVVKVDIRSDLFGALDKDTKDKPSDLFILNCGKSVIFPSTEKDLIDVMNKEPFSLKILLEGSFLASMTAAWTEDFYSLLKLGDAEPNFASMSSKYKLMDADELMGHIKARVRLTLHGNSIESNFRIMNSNDISTKGKKYLIKNSSRSPIYGYNKTDEESKNEGLPMCPMISPNLSINTIADPSSNIKISFTALFSASFGPNLSVAPDEFSKGMGETPCNYSKATFDILSIVERPDEKKYFDLHIRVSSAGFSFYLDKDKDVEAAPILENEEDLNDLTIDKINNMLCNSKDCPAARMFRKFGIGPLATVNNLGAAYCPVSPPSKYGLSQTYGTLDDYGAYGILHSEFDDPFDKERNALAMYYKYKNNTPSTSKCSENNRDKPLRLRGGGLLDYDNDNNPFAECRQVMAQFDHVLEKFKQTMGPCGKSTCPFAPNIVRESCKNICKHPMDFDAFSDSHVCPFRPGECLSPLQPPPPPPPRPVMTQGACGSPKCPYSKYKAGMMEEDDLVDLEFLPPTLTGRCGMPKCPFPPEPELPPIHWDCPEALPVGPCKNPDCPHKPKDLSILNKVMPQSYCGNSGCPYKIPPPCQSPDCPFSKPECPYEKQRKAAGEKNGGRKGRQNGNGDDSGDYAEDETCENPDCPYAPQDESSEMCENPDCPYAPQDDNEMCENPDCPYALNNDTMDDADETCANPDCPYAARKANSCGNPSCPYVMGEAPKSGPCTKTVMQTNSFCENPDCSAAPKSQKKAMFCGSPSCPYGPSEDDMSVCHSPECPVGQKPSPCVIPSSRDCYTPPPPEPMGCPVPVYFPCGFPPQSSCGPKIVACYPPPVPLCGQYCPYPMGGAFDLCLHSGPCPYMSPVCPPPICTTLPPQPEICGPAPAASRKPTRTSACFVPGSGDDGSFTSDGNRKESLGGQSRPSLMSQLSKPYRKEIADDEPTTLGTLEYSSDTRVGLDSSPCGPGTCQAEGGNLECTECICSGGAVKGASGSKLIRTGSLKVDKKKRRKRKLYKHKMGEKYTGVTLGHRDCCMTGGAVPGNMGWLWNIPPIGMKPRRGWRPGAVGKAIAEMILRHREAQGLMRQLDAKRIKNKKSLANISENTKPTLKIQKREGCYWITMNPLKDPFSVKENENPYMDCTPMQFKIVKNKDGVNVRDGDGDYKTCYCGDGDGDGSNRGSNADSSGSELDIEFTPPAAIVDPKRFRKKREKADTQTQYLASDIPKDEKKKDKKGKKGKKDKKKGKKK